MFVMLSMGRRREHWVLISLARDVCSGEGMGVLERYSAPGEPAPLDRGKVEAPEKPALSIEEPDSTEEVLCILRERAISILRGAKEPLHFFGASELSSLGWALFLSEPTENGISKSLSRADMSKMPDSVAELARVSADLGRMSGDPKEALAGVAGEELTLLT